VALRNLENPAEGADLTVDDLKHMQSTNFREMMATMLLPLGERRIYCFGINVHPTFQGRGVGSELIRWVSRKADEDDVKV
jgi:ribosomal protein S18 acetylase RimI-like enzyme